MVITVKRIFCPACGAPIRGDQSGTVSCDYCSSTLMVEARRVSERPKVEHKVEPTGPPPSTLSSEDIGRFEVSLLEQVAPDTVQDGFSTLALPEGRFALIFLRLADLDSKTMEADYSNYCRALVDSLSRHEDPGLAAFELLEHLSQELHDFRLEITITLFNPQDCSVTAYNAGSQRSVYWVSAEEGRVIDVFRSYPALERKMLRMSKDHFSNSSPIYLSASDLVVGVSAAFAGRGGGPYSDGTGPLLNSLNDHLGEHPLKVVTLAKNAFWQKRSPAASEYPLSGTLRVAAVRAKASEVGDQAMARATLRLAGREFEVCRQAMDTGHAEILPLHGDREVFVWAHGADFREEEYDTLKRSILQVLDRADHGDNENPRCAGRAAFEAVGHSGRILVVLFLNAYGRAKWYRHGWAQPLGLGPRGLSDPPSSQMFDEGGEATVPEGTRLFFPGSIPFRKSPKTVLELAHTWYGGKASAFYGALFAHWRTPDGLSCLNQVLSAVRADVPEAALDGCCLVGRCR
jgi:DNA-directed RNA polymerase subunit RPC12/RpoP